MILFIEECLKDNFFKMKSKTRHAIYLFFFILITSTQFSRAHNSFNGGCKNHCKKSVSSTNSAKELDNINQFEDNYSCLNKSLCRG